MAYKLSIIVPIVVTQEIHNEVKDALANHFGGYSSFLINGGWKKNGVLYTEQSVLYFSLTGQPQKLVQEMGEYLEQYIKEHSMELSVMWWYEQGIRYE